MICKLSRWLWAGAGALAFVAGIVNVVGLLGFEHQAVNGLRVRPRPQRQLRGEVDLRQCRDLRVALYLMPIPLAVDGQVVCYAHVDVSGSKESSQTVLFADLAPGEREVKAGVPAFPWTHKSVKITATPPAVRFVRRRSRPWPQAKAPAWKPVICLTAIFP